MDEEVGGEGLYDLGSVGFEVADVAGGGGVGAGHALADLPVGEALAAEVVGLEALGSLGGVHLGLLVLVLAFCIDGVEHVLVCRRAGTPSVTS